MIKNPVLAVILLISNFVFGSFNVYLPHKANVENIPIENADSLTSEKIKIDTGGYVLLISDQGQIIEIDSAGIYDLSTINQQIKDDSLPSSLYAEDLKVLLQVDTLKKRYERTGSVVCRPSFDTKSSHFLIIGDHKWIKGIPLKPVMYTPVETKKSQLLLKNMWHENLLIVDIKDGQLFLDSDSLFESLYSLDSILLIEFQGQAPDNSFNSIASSLTLVRDQKMKSEYDQITQFGYSPMIKDLVLFCFYKSNNLRAYTARQLVQLKKYKDTHEIITSILLQETRAELGYLGAQWFDRYPD